MKRLQKDALLLTVCLAQFMVILDISIVNVALPDIHSSLGFSDTGLQWVVNAYTLTFAGFLMLAGRATDLLPAARSSSSASASSPSPRSAARSPTARASWSAPARSRASAPR